MTDPIASLAEALDTLPLAVRRAVVGLVQTFGEFLLDYNRRYLLRGERPDGESIQPQGYSRSYAAYRAKYGLQTAVVDLTFTKAFAKGFRLPYVGGGTFEVENIDPKADKLLSSYGELYGVREEDIEDFITARLLPEIEQVIAHHMNA